MRLKKNLSQLVESNFTPLCTDKEGLLRGGFGAMTFDAAAHVAARSNYLFCNNDNCNDGCSNDCNKSCAPPSKSGESAALFQGF